MELLPRVLIITIKVISYPFYELTFQNLSISHSGQSIHFFEVKVRENPYLATNPFQDVISPHNWPRRALHPKTTPELFREFPTSFSSDIGFHTDIYHLHGLPHQQTSIPHRENRHIRQLHPRSHQGGPLPHMGPVHWGRGRQLHIRRSRLHFHGHVLRLTLPLRVPRRA